MRINGRRLMIADKDRQIIHFADPAVEKLLLANMDNDKDGKITMGEARKVRQFGSYGLLLQNNTDIKTFDELRYFTGLIQEHWNGRTGVSFAGCSNLESVTMPRNYHTLFFSQFAGCTSLKNLNGLEGITTVQGDIFRGSSPLIETMILPNATTFDGTTMYGPGSSLNSMAHLKRLECPAVVDGSGLYYFTAVDDLIIILGEHLTTLNGGFWAMGQKAKEHNCKLVIKATTPPAIKKGDLFATYYQEKSPVAFDIYVPDDAVDTYKSSDGFKFGYIHPISEIEQLI